MIRFIALALLLAAGSVMAFQLAPTGSSFEAKLTNETPSTLGRIAGRLGVLIKAPVHEEITQIGYGCPADAARLLSDDSCAGADRPFATAFVIYGVRWNDLPPFKLSANEGTGCKKLLTRTPACNVEQTVRFSTQPDCWYCMFGDAQEKAKTHRITGCRKGAGYLAGNLLTRSHFGDLQFLHGMANEDGISAEETHKKIIDWIEFAWKVSSREIAPTTQLRTISIPTIKEHFGCSEWTVADVYILGRQPQLLPQLRSIAFGSVLHTVQDSFAEGHTTRESRASEKKVCDGTNGMPVPRRIVEFHSYAGQDGHKHDQRDQRAALLEGRPASQLEGRLLSEAAAMTEAQFPDAVNATRVLADLSGMRWAEAEPYVRCLFTLAPSTRASSAGDAFR